MPLYPELIVSLLIASPSAVEGVCSADRLTEAGLGSDRRVTVPGSL
jgi:hypothetical protein